MIRKLFALVSSSCCADNPDSPQHQEILLPGSLYAMIIKERLEECLNAVRAQIAQDVRRKNAAVDFFDSMFASFDPRIYHLLLARQKDTLTKYSKRSTGTLGRNYPTFSQLATWYHQQD